MPSRVRHILRLVVAGLALVVLTLSAAQLSLGGADRLQSHATHTHVVRMYAVAAPAGGPANAPSTDPCDTQTHGLACCSVSCAMGAAWLPANPRIAALAPAIVVSYIAAPAGSPDGLAIGPALRPPQRVG